MTLELAFAKALETQPGSKMGPRIKRAMRQANSKTAPADSGCQRKEVEALGYRARQLGRRWASLRLGCCAWVGPIDKLRVEWQALGEELAGLDAVADEWADILRHLAEGIGLDEAIGCRERSYLLQVVEAAGDSARLCRPEGVRLFSPFTLLLAAVNDLADATLDQRAALHDLLSSAPPSTADLTYAARMQAFRGSLAGWLPQAH